VTQLASPPPTRRSAQDAAPADGMPLPPSHSATSGQRIGNRGSATQRGRHATPTGQGFGYLVGWTIASAALPGSGLVAAGRRVVGWLLIALSLGSLLGVILYVISEGGPVNAAMGMRDLVLDPAKLTQIAVVTLVIGVSWSLVILLSHLTLRRQALPTGLQNLFATGLVTALVLGVAVPSAKASSLALIQKNFLSSVFSAGEPTTPKANAPSVKKKDPWAGVPRVNVLLMGSDAGKGRTGLRPDTVILASVNTKTGDTVMFSLPRNLQRAPFPEGSEGAQAWPNGFGPVGSGPGSAVCGTTGELCFLNAVWRTAEESARDYFPGDKNPGLTATEQAVQGVLGLDVDYYVMLDLKGFQQFIDAIGGIKLDVKERLPIGGNSENRHAEEWIEVGDNQDMNGFHALWFARSRWKQNDYDRMRRQRCVIAAVSDQADPLTIVKNFNGVAKALKNNLETDIPVKELKAWGDLAMRIKEGKVRSLPFTDEVITSADPDWNKMQQLVQKSLKPTKKASSGTKATSGSNGEGSQTGTGTTSPTKKPTKPKAVDPSVAQDVGAVC
jgi:LCP family protein required for cell wall assembly